MAITAVNEIVDQVWDEAQADHVAAGSFGIIASEIASILADTGTDGVVLASNSITAAAIATAGALKIADEILKRGVENVEDTADATSLAGVILAVFESVISGTSWIIKKTDGTTFIIKTVSVDSNAVPVVGVT